MNVKYTILHYDGIYFCQNKYYSGWLLLCKVCSTGKIKIMVATLTDKLTLVSNKTM